MERPLRILSEHLRSNLGEDPLVEWKLSMPVQRRDKEGKEDLARTIVALANSVAYYGGNEGYLFIGVSRDRRLVGLETHPEAHKMLADLVRPRTIPPMSDYELRYYAPETLRVVFPDAQIINGIYCVIVKRPYPLPYGYRCRGRGPGVFLIRHGSNIVEPDPSELLSLFARTVRGPSELLKPKEMEILSNAVEQATLIIERLRLRERKSASRLAYNLLLAYDGTWLLGHFQYTPVLVMPLIKQRVNPFNLLATANGHRVRFKSSSSPRRLQKRYSFYGIAEEIKAWEGLRTAYSRVLREGLPWDLRKHTGQWDFSGFARSLGHEARRQLEEAGRSKLGDWPYLWIGRSISLNSWLIPPKGWVPQDPFIFVEGVLKVDRYVLKPIPLAGIQVRLPIFSQSPSDRNLLWWAIFLDPHVFLQLTAWAEAFPTGFWFHPWEREPWDLLEQGRLAPEDLPKKLEAARSRVRKGPLYLGLSVMLIMTVLALYSIVMRGEYFLIAMAGIMWATLLLPIASARLRNRAKND